MTPHGRRSAPAGHSVDRAAEDLVVQKNALQRALRAAATEGEVIVGPWTGEVGFELLYWIPYLTWLSTQGISPSRMVVVSRGGAAAWYRHLTSRYIDILDLMSPDEFRSRTEGKKKQYDERRTLDREIVARVRERLSSPEACLVHPASMFRLFSALFRGRATIDLVESYSVFRALMPPDADGGRGLPELPPEYVVAKFYFSKAFPDTLENRRFVASALDVMSRHAPVVLMTAGVRLDEHVDAAPIGSDRLMVVDSHLAPSSNLELQTRLILGARAFVGTYGGFSYLAPFYGVPSLSFFSRPHGFERHHLDLAARVFDRLLPGGFHAIDHRAGGALDAIRDALGRPR